MSDIWDVGATSADSATISATSERSEAVEFVALTADVAPTSQMSLFGGPATVAPAFAPATAPAGAGEVEDEPEEPSVSNYERRALLRDKRHRLVGDLRRRDGRSHREINAWLNQSVGVARVQDATIDQLERSVDLLLDALAGRPARR
jgi:hypothetical protein